MRIRAYLDNNATTRMAKPVLSAMMQYLEEGFLNPSSTAGELLGAGKPLDEAQTALAILLGSRDLAGRFALTSGASESNSWAISAAASLRPHKWVCSAIEHPSVLAAAEAIRDERGIALHLVKPDSNGRISADNFLEAVSPDTGFVSVMAANSETGVIQPVDEIARRTRAIAPMALIHVDATQAIGRISLDLNAGLDEVDLLSLSAHKMHGPKGVGALFIRDGISLPPMIFGSKTRSSRGGTANTPGAAGLAAAATLSAQNIAKMRAVAKMRDGLEQKLLSAMPHAIVNGRAVERLPNTSSVSIPGLNAAAAVEQLALEGICVATGSACSSGAVGPSHVLTAMGIGYDLAKATLRLSLSYETTDQEIDLVAEHIMRIASESRA